MKTIAAVFICLLLIAPAAKADDTLTLACEVMEVSGPLKSTSTRLEGVRFLLLHHANAADRETLSTWLKQNSGTEIRFLAGEVKHKGVLCRLAQCFGRGLLIWQGEGKVEKRDIIQVILPVNP